MELRVILEIGNYLSSSFPIEERLETGRCIITTTI